MGVPLCPKASYTASESDAFTAVCQAETVFQILGKPNILAIVLSLSLSLSLGHGNHCEKISQLGLLHFTFLPHV
jgi:hypothetical protein